MWVLPSRSRPHNIARLARVWQETGASTSLWLRLDDDDPRLSEYLVLALPEGWTREVGPRRPLGAIYNEAYQRAPERLWWGFIGDDVVPVTQGWDTALIEAAGDSRMAVPAGGHDQKGTEGAPHFVLGGGLPRVTGWLCLPGLDRLYIDTVWQTYAERRGALVRCPEIVLEHHHFSNRKALRDQTYLKHHKAEDRALYESWLAD